LFFCRLKKGVWYYATWSVMAGVSWP
jgi:hypothetical protein